MPLKLIFAGTPDFSAHHLQALIESPHEIVGVYTQPDRRGKKGKSLVPSPVKQLAEAHSLPVYQPLNFKDITDQQQLQALNADVMVVVAYGLILPKIILDAPYKGCINVHTSLLPRWRGAAPIERAIEAGDNKTGVTIMQMDEGLDTGDMLLTLTLPIDATETGGSLQDKLIQQGKPALLDTLQQIENDTLQPISQNSSDIDPTYASKLSKQEAEINWDTHSLQLDRKIRAFNPHTIPYFIQAGDRIRVWKAQEWQAKPIHHDQHQSAPGTILCADNDGLLVACKDSSLLITELQVPGKKAMPIQAILNGYRDRFAVGCLLA